VAASVLGGRERLAGAPAVVCSPRLPPDASGDSTHRDDEPSSTQRRCAGASQHRSSRHGSASSARRCGWRRESLPFH